MTFSPSHGLSLTRVSYSACPPLPGIPLSAGKIGPSCLNTNGTAVRSIIANNRSVEYALIRLVVQHGWQSRARGSHPHGHSVSTTPGVAGEASMHGIGTRAIVQTYVRRTEMELACVHSHPLVFVKLYVALFFGTRRLRGISTRPPRACALFLASRRRGVDIKAGRSSMPLCWLFVNLHEEARSHINKLTTERRRSQILLFNKPTPTMTSRSTRPARCQHKSSASCSSCRRERNDLQQVGAWASGPTNTRTNPNDYASFVRDSKLPT